MELIRRQQIHAFSTNGITSHQLLNPENSASTRVTITKVTVPLDHISPRHEHVTSEQIWIAISGTATLLLANNTTEIFNAGDVARFADGDTHGVHNTGVEPFIYISVTSPPINFRQAYSADWSENISSDRTQLNTTQT
jgi:mannose-6-phosphate isomerase-like protein (cupin superfamily)